MSPLEEVLAALQQFGTPARRNGVGWKAKCPAHDDRNPSLSISEGDDGRALLKCFAGCEVKDIVAELGLREADLFLAASTLTPLRRRSQAQGAADTEEHSSSRGLTLDALSEAKGLPADLLRSIGCADLKYQGAPAVRIPYYSETGKPGATRYRVSLDAEPRFKWKVGSKTTLYGLERLGEVREAGWVLLLEGESDCWTAWHHGLPALGAPGKSTWRAEWAPHVDDLDVYVWQEPDAEDFTARIYRDVPGVRVIVAPHDSKDLSAAHLAGEDVPTLVEQLKASAVSAASIVRQAADEDRTRLKAEARPILDAPDPLVDVWNAIEAVGYGGDRSVPMTVYLAATSRLLLMRPGAMPVHALLIGPASAGKSYALGTALSLVPPEAVVSIDAGSPRALIYDDRSLEHRVLVFGEADSLPSSEDNPAASAVRTLLQENRLRYDVTCEDRENGGYAVRHIDKPGPTVCITTSTKSLGPQLMSRLFVLEARDTQDQTRAALTAQAAIELHGAAEPAPALIAYQAYLQTLAPWDVVVPFVDELAQAIGRRPAASRVLRDFARLVSLVKAVAVLRHCHRERDACGRVVAEIADYEAVLLLVDDLFEASVTGASDAVREVVAAVDELVGDSSPSVSVTEISTHVGLTKQATSGRVKRAIDGGWLINKEERRGRRYEIVLGEPLPERDGLPAPDELSAMAGDDGDAPST
jgi:hypothetical protein